MLPNLLKVGLVKVLDVAELFGQRFQELRPEILDEDVFLLVVCAPHGRPVEGELLGLHGQFHLLAFVLHRNAVWFVVRCKLEPMMLKSVPLLCPALSTGSTVVSLPPSVHRLIIVLSLHQDFCRSWCRLLLGSCCFSSKPTRLQATSLHLFDDLLNFHASTSWPCRLCCRLRFLVLFILLLLILLILLFFLSLLNFHILVVRLYTCLGLCLTLCLDLSSGLAIWRLRIGLHPLIHIIPELQDLIFCHALLESEDAQSQNSLRHLSSARCFAGRLEALQRTFFSNLCVTGVLLLPMCILPDRMLGRRIS
mmetsp:Transcript_1353/g.2691  ORF Transcript_1353/g.2691 Transcript_1353/m.2691 type:complete len:308 (-) Transcript_1353:335-1258(-)